MGKLNVDGTEIQVLQIEEDDYISLTDMVRKIDNGSALIEKWLRNKNTIEFLTTVQGCLLYQPIFLSCHQVLGKPIGYQWGAYIKRIAYCHSI